MASTAGANLVGRTVGNFRIAERLGGGGMGEVYLLRHSRLPNTLAALKVLRAGTAAVPYVKERFVQEALVAAAIGSDRVARPIDLGRFDDGAPYIVLEYAPGRTLARELEQRGPLPVATALRICHRIADTMVLVHVRGIVHRDLKPSNIMLDGEADDPCVKILDFGVARAPAALRLAQTVENTVVGSPGYMSPEAATGDAVDTKSDVFSLGATLYRCLTPSVPFPLAGAASASLLAEPAPTIAARRPDDLDPAPPALEDLVARMLAKSPADRPSMAVVRDAIARITDVPAQKIVHREVSAIAATDDAVASTITLGGRVPDVELGAIRARLEELCEGKLPTAIVVPKQRRLVVALVALVALGAGISAVAMRSRKPRASIVLGESELVETVTTEESTGPELLPSGQIARVSGHEVVVESPGSATLKFESPDRRELAIIQPSSVPDSILAATHLNGGDCRWFLLRLDGGKPLPIDEELPCGLDLDVTPDTTTLAVTSNAGLKVRDLRTGAQRFLNTSYAGATLPRWAPDGARLMISRPDTIIIVDPSGVELGRRQAVAGAWLDANRIAYVAGRELRLARIDQLSDAARDERLSSAMPAGVVLMQASHRGLMLQQMEKHERAYVMPRRSGSPPTPLRTGALEDFEVLGWTAQGEVVTEALTREGRALIRTAPDSDGSVLVRLLRGTFGKGGITEDLAFYKMIDGDRCAIGIVDARTGAHRPWRSDPCRDSPSIKCAARAPACIIKAAGTTNWLDLHTLTIGATAPEIPRISVLSPDGTEVAVRDAARKRITITKIADGTTETLDPQPPLPAMYDARWGDGQTLLVVAEDNEARYIIELARSGGWRTLLKVQAYFPLYPSMSPDGATVAFIARTSMHKWFYVPITFR